MKETILDALDHVGEDLIDEYFDMCAVYEQKRAKRWPKRRWVSLVAACLAVVLIGTYAVWYISKGYDLDYVLQAEYDKMVTEALTSEDPWIYYVNKNGVMRRERAHFEESSVEDRFLAWRHLNGIGEDVKLINTEYMTNASNAEGLGQVIAMYPVDSTVAFVTISQSIQKYDHHEALIEALKKTLCQNFVSCEIMLK